ncbi:DUF6556 family protein [Streptococcus henryi]|uniref:DUF6556 family protein n=1 Tax=Streptococcus henryi TaxID=439219 RepID=UPI000375648A|nr:DUF6556 family protein [Streptococcus henryi]
MSQNYSRQNKKKTSKSNTHIKTGFTAFQKTLAFIGSILSIIVATLTIRNAITGANQNKTNDSSSTGSTTIIIKEKDSNTEASDSNSGYVQDSSIQESSADASTDSSTESSQALENQDTTPASTEQTSTEASSSESTQ